MRMELMDVRFFGYHLSETKIKIFDALKGDLLTWSNGNFVWCLAIPLSSLPLAVQLYKIEIEEIVMCISTYTFYMSIKCSLYNITFISFSFLSYFSDLK